MRVSVYIQGDIGVSVYLGGQKGEGRRRKTEEVGSGVVAYKDDKMYVTNTHTHTQTQTHTNTHTHTHTHTQIHTHTYHGVSVAFGVPRDCGCV